MGKSLSLLVLTVLVTLSACTKISSPPCQSGKADASPQTQDDLIAQSSCLQQLALTLNNEGACTDDAIRTAVEPDERFNHCHGEPWHADATPIKNLLNDPGSKSRYCSAPFTPMNLDYRIVCNSPQTLSNK